MSFARRWIHRPVRICTSETKEASRLKVYALSSSLAISALSFFSPKLSHSEAVRENGGELPEQHEMKGSADVRPCKRSSYTAYTRQGDQELQRCHHAGLSNMLIDWRPA